MTPLELIRVACVKANPEIVELKFGCEIERGHPRREFYVGGFNDCLSQVKALVNDEKV